MHNVRVDTGNCSDFLKGPIIHSHLDVPPLLRGRCFLFFPSFFTGSGRLPADRSCLPCTRGRRRCSNGGAVRGSGAFGSSRAEVRKS